MHVRAKDGEKHRNEGGISFEACESWILKLSVLFPRLGMAGNGG